VTGTFEPIEIEVPRARLNTPDGRTTEWRSSALRAYQRRTLAADALIASTYLAGTNTRRVRRALAALFGGAVGKDTVSRVWRKVKTREVIEARRKAFIRKWRLKHRAVADSLEEAGDRLFTFTRLPPTQWKSARTTNAIERLHEEFKRRIKTQAVLPSADTAAMLFWALLASGQFNMRKVDGWQTLATKPIDQPIDLAA
jgi:transposase-like protein